MLSNAATIILPNTWTLGEPDNRLTCSPQMWTENVDYRAIERLKLRSYAITARPKAWTMEMQLTMKVVGIVVDGPVNT
jgi:hypothetical protein